MYKLLWGTRGSEDVSELDNAVDMAKLRVGGLSIGVPVIIQDANRVTIGVVTDDANGVTLHKLKTWPGEETALLRRDIAPGPIDLDADAANRAAALGD